MVMLDLLELEYLILTPKGGLNPFFRLGHFSTFLSKCHLWKLWIKSRNDSKFQMRTLCQMIIWTWYFEWEYLHFNRLMALEPFWALVRQKSRYRGSSFVYFSSVNLAVLRQPIPPLWIPPPCNIRGVCLNKYWGWKGIMTSLV